MRIDYRIKTLVGLGKSLAILMVLLWLDRPTGEQELIEHTHYDGKTVRKYLRDLSEHGYITRTTRFRGWMLTNSTRQMMLEMVKPNTVLLEGVVETAGNTYMMIKTNGNISRSPDEVEEISRSMMRTNGNISRSADEVDENSRSSNEEEENSRSIMSTNGNISRMSGNNSRMNGKISRSPGLINLTTTTHISPISPQPVVVVNPEVPPEMSGDIEEPLAEEWEEEDNDDSLDGTLRSAGIYGQVRKELKYKPGLTADIVRRLEETLEERKGKRYTPGLLVHCLRNLDLAELEEHPAEEDYRRYVRGKYAEFIQH